MSDFAATLKKLESNKAVKIVVVFGKENEIIHPPKTQSNAKALDRISKTIPPIIEKAKLLVKNIDQTNDLTFLHFKSGKEEIMIAPGDDESLVAISDISRLDA